MQIFALFAIQIFKGMIKEQDIHALVAVVRKQIHYVFLYIVKALEVRALICGILFRSCADRKRRFYKDRRVSADALDTHELLKSCLSYALERAKAIYQAMRYIICV